jgi:hypothetical protein
VGGLLGGGDLLDGFGGAPSGDLHFGRGEGLLLDGRAAGAGAALEVVLEARVRLVLRDVLGELLVDGELELGLSVALEAMGKGGALDCVMVFFMWVLRRVGVAMGEGWW